MKLNNLRIVATHLPRIRHLFFDFDGVFTPNSVLIDENGREAALCSRLDGLGLIKLKSIDMSMSILSTETNPIVLHRAKKLGIHVNHEVKDKLAFAENFIRERDFDLSNIAFVGNDENDLGLLEKVGLSFAPQDGWPTVINVVDFVTDRAGGKGCVREICEFLFEIEKVKND